jgi:hydroxymethylbilane synthase
MSRVLRIGTRDSQLAVWQATLVQQLLQKQGYASELVYMKSEGDIDIVTPLYELGVQGVFTKTLDAALLNERIDIAVHSMKDVPTQLAQGIRQAAVLERASTKDILVYKEAEDLAKLGVVNGQWTGVNSQLSIVNEETQIDNSQLTIDNIHHSQLTTHNFTIATGSIRRIAQWKHRFPNHSIDNLRGNVNTRLRKLAESNWNGAIFAAAGLERINLRPTNSIDLDWMLPAPAQGAIMIVCREADTEAADACLHFNHEDTALCTKIERDFLRALLGGCSTPISGLATVKNGEVIFAGNIVSPDGKLKTEIEKRIDRSNAGSLGMEAAKEILSRGGQQIVALIRNKPPNETN